MKTVAIHQPNYLPWLGFFYKMYAADEFILLDDVPYSKGSFTARTLYRQRIGQQDKGYLIVPMKKTPLGTPIDQIEIDHSRNWPKKQLNQLHNTYRSAPYFDQYFPLLEQWMDMGANMRFLADWNSFLIREIMDLLGIPTRLIYSSQMAAMGQGTAYLVDLIREVKGTGYLSGPGGKKYQEETLYGQFGISLQYINSFGELDRLRYSQQQGDWLNGLSILDALFNIGAEEVKELFTRFQRLP